MTAYIPFLAPISLAIMAGLRTLWGFRTLHATWTPDYDLYTQGGIGWYPSPLGRLFGWTGFLGYINVAACVLMPLLAALISKRHGGRPVIAALMCTFAPLAWVGAWASVDVIAVCFLLAALYYHPVNKPLAALFAVAATLTHWALLPFALLVFARKKDLRWLIPLGVVLFLPAMQMMLTTKYGTQVDKFALAKGVWGFTGTFLIVGALSVFVLWPVLQNRGLAFVWLVVAAAEAGFQNHVHVRYGLPAAVFAASSVGVWRLSHAKRQQLEYEEKFGQSANLHPSQGVANA